MHFTKPAAPLVFLALVACLSARAEKETVCTITVNSADEREALRRHLPEERFSFVELVEHGRSDWLASACHRKVQCDVLVVSGHFAGTEFYSSRPDVAETFPVDEMERVACGPSCPDLFSHLKEVYLFGCDTLKPEPAKSAMPEIVRGMVRAGMPRAEAERSARALSERYAENNRARMRRLFPGVPLIYGFSSLAPYGRTAGPMLEGYFQSGGGGEFGSGRPSAKLLALFAPSSMVATAGWRDDEPDADQRAESCRLHDERNDVAARLDAVHSLLAAEDADLRMSFDRIEQFLPRLRAEGAGDATYVRAAERLAFDAAARARYLALTHETADPALRLRMVAVAREAGWLDRAGERTEQVRAIADLVVHGPVGFGEVDLVCTLNGDHALDAALDRLAPLQLAIDRTAAAAALACLGSPVERGRVIRALASADERDVQVAQAYLRHRPITEAAELRAVAREIVGMRAVAAQVRALETLARQHLLDPQVVDDLESLYASTASAQVQRAIAEIFLRAGLRAANAPELAQLLRRHRLRATPGGGDLIDAVLRNLES